MSTAITVSRFHRATIRILELPVRLRIDRLNVRDATAFHRDFWRVDQPMSEQALRFRKPDELETRPKARPRSPAEIAAVEALYRLRERVDADLGRDVDIALEAFPDQPDGEEFVVTDTEIRRRRLAEMTADERDTWNRQVAEDDAFAFEFLQRAVKHVRVEPGQVFIEEEDGTKREVTDGAELVELFGSDPQVRRQVVWAVWFENNATDELKNALRSQLDSGGSSNERDQAAVGLRPEAPAANVKSEVFAGSEAAMASTADV
jgi:hypothetical protein